jgi:hypothetical protein
VVFSQLPVLNADASSRPEGDLQGLPYERKEARESGLWLHYVYCAIAVVNGEPVTTGGRSNQFYNPSVCIVRPKKPNAPNAVHNSGTVAAVICLMSHLPPTRTRSSFEFVCAAILFAALSTYRHSK